MQVGVRRAGVVVGREAELERLRGAVRRALAGEAACVLLSGEGGVGKSRLVAETAAVAHRLDAGVLAGRAPITTPVAFSVVAEALRSWLRGHRLERAPTPFDRGLRLVLPEWTCLEEDAELSDAQLRLLAFEGVVRLIREIAATERAAIVLVDDLHAGDPESIEAVRYLATAAIPGTAVIGALRPGVSSLGDELVRALRRDGVADVLDVAPLDERGVGALLAALLDADPPAPLVADIVARTDGVPLLVEEVLDAHLRAGSVELGAGGAAWRGGDLVVPRTVRDMVGDRLAALPRGHRDVLVAGAVLGDFDAAAMPRVAAVDATGVADALADGVRIGLLETASGAVVFRHAIIREAVLDSTVPHAVEVMHRRAEAVFGAARGDDARALERRAHHLAALGDGDAAAGLLAAAAEIRIDEHALLGAERLARRARDLARAPAGQAAAADAIARSLSAQGRWSEALAVDEATIAEHGDSLARRHRMANSALEAGRPELARPIIDGALAGGDESAAIRIAAGRAALVGGDAQIALAFAARVLESGGAGAEECDPDERLAALDLQGRAHDFLGRRDDAESSWERQAAEARAAGRTISELRAVVQLGKVELFAGRRPQRLREAVELARRAGALVELAWAEENLAIGLAIHGDLAASREVLAESIARCRELRLDQLPYLLVAQAAVESATHESVDAILDEAEALLPTDEVRLHALGIRADVALRRGRYEDAVHWCRVAADIMRSMPGIVPTDTSCYLVWALAGAGRFDEAAEALGEARAMPDLARWYGRPVLVAAATALLAGDEDGVDEAITNAPAHMPHDVARMRVVGAEVIRGPARARWLREALDIYESMQMTVDADRTRRLLREAGAPVPRRRAVAADVPESLARRGITSRELEVLRLLGEGLPNADIAARLFLSVRTVETHVSSMLGKLELGNRGQLIALSVSTLQGT
ncbi:MAG TPA: AAA family ATPase [Candidatus Dormibacteraeota bacterium]|nr:AAA family ATPase [Candidatus Dormibacteraeota bacterium]